MKRHYECTFIVNPGLDDPQIENVVKAVEDSIVKNGGEVVSKEALGRRRLAYPIAKKHNGYYSCIEFEAEGHIIDKVERFLKLDENIMRYLTLQLDKRELDARQRRAELLVAMAAEKEAASQEKTANTGAVAKTEEKEPEKQAEEKEQEA